MDTPAAPDAGTPATSPPPLPPALPAPVDASPAPISGFWRRFAAFLIDALLLGGIGLLIGMVYSDALARMGGWERLIGLAVVLAYAGVLNSRVGGGRTLGKRLLGIRVIGLDGALLSLPRTLARQLVFATPFFLNGAPIDVSTMMSFVGILVSVAVFGGMFSIIYLAVFNRRSRRSLHDLVAGSYVVRDTSDIALPAPPTWRGHLVVVALLVALSAAVPFVAERLAKTQLFEGILPVYEALASRPGVLEANVSVGQTFGTNESTYVTVALKIDTPRVDDEDRAREAARYVLEAYPPAAEKDAIVVTLHYGYNMVIASKTRSWTFRFEPDELADDR